MIDSARRSAAAAIVAAFLFVFGATAFAPDAAAQLSSRCAEESTIACADGNGAQVQNQDGNTSKPGSKPRPRPGRPGGGGGGDSDGGHLTVELEPVQRPRADITNPGWWEGTCDPDPRVNPECFLPPEPAEVDEVLDPDAPGAPPPDPETVVRHAIAKIEFPTAPPQVGPPPSINEWNAAVVGYPLWLWNDAGPLSASDSDQGLTVSLQATPVSTRFDMGDGEKVTCADTTPWTRRVKTSAPSPTCGYTYQLPSLNKAGRVVPLTLQQVTTWKIDWTAGSQSGTLNAYVPSDTTTMRVVELQAIITG